MRVIGLLALVAAVVVGFSTPSHAYLTPGFTSGVEVVAQPGGSLGWDVTIETSQDLGGGTLNVIGAANYAPANPPCDDNALTCAPAPSANGLNVALFVFTSSGFVANVGSPTSIGSFDNVLGFDDTDLQANWGSVYFQNLGGADILPVTFVVVPEPGTMVLLGAGLAGLAFLRRRTV